MSVLRSDNNPVIVVASAGRPDLLAASIDRFSQQTVPVTVVVSIPDKTSIPCGYAFTGEVVTGHKGLTRQRNAGMDAAEDATHFFFFDDDSVVREDFVENALDFFEAHPECVALTGRVLLDGAAGEEIPPDLALLELAQSRVRALTGRWESTTSLYGCNFAVRAGAGGVRFDERLPLYGWLEDLDFACRVARHGTLAKVDDCVIVHLGAKSGGRTAHQRLGYAQVMNPWYLRSTRSFSTSLAWRESWRRVVKNAVGAAFGPDMRMRRLRLKGNLRALNDLAQRKYTPERMASLPQE